MKIVIMDEKGINTGDISWDVFHKIAETKIFSSMTSLGCIEAMKEADCLISIGTEVTSDMIEQCKNLQYIGTLSTGYDGIDIAHAKTKGIVVTNVPTYGTESVAQYTFALILELCHRVGLHDQSVRDGEWGRRNCFSYWLKSIPELHGKTLGIVGFGRIGQTVARIGQAFGMIIMGYDPFIPHNTEVNGFTCYTLDDVLASADVLTLHCPLTSDNKNLINCDTIAKMKQGVMLINAARGPLVHEGDLVSALQSGDIGAAALDVANQEPLPDSSPLFNAPNLILTPHIAWATTEARQRIVQFGADNLEAFIDGTPFNVVNP